MKNYYTASEAQDRLGMNEGNFYYLVKTGKIKKFTPPGKKQGLYPKTEIDRLAREMLAFMVYDETQGLQFMKATTDDDFKEEHELAALLFGNSIHSLETRMAWLEKNPDLDFIIRDHGRLVGFINLLPTKHEAIMRFMNGEIRGWEISPEDVLPFTPGSSMECIIMGMATAQDVEITRRVQYGAKLLSGLIEFLCELAEKNISITKFYATSATPTGISILKNAGFQEIGQIGKRIAFELDVKTSHDRLATEYRQALSNNLNGKPIGI
jgi:hypothetical protein